MPNTALSERLSSGLPDLDVILGGGFVAGSAYLLRGGPGQGKTTLGLHYLTAGTDGDNPLFIGFQEDEAQLRSNAASIGIDVAGVSFLTLVPDEHFFAKEEGYDVFPSGDVERLPIAAAVTQEVERLEPKRVFVDSMTQLRFLSADPFQFRKQVLSFLRFLRDRGVTLLFSSERSVQLPDDDLQFLADGILSLDSTPDGGYLEVSKFRGSGFRRGAHQYRVGSSGLEVFPRSRPPRRVVESSERIRWSSGVQKMDQMLHGGLEAGTITLVTGPSGSGKSTLAAMFVAEAAKRGRNAAFFAFEEEVASLLERCDKLGIPLNPAVEKKQVVVEQVEPLRFLSDEFALRVERLVASNNLDMVVIDSLSGYELTLGESESARSSLHALAKSLARNGVTVILVNEVEAVTGEFRVSERGISYLADNVILMRYLESGGELRKIIAILKKRFSGFDRRLLPYEIGPERIVIHEPEDNIHGILSGVHIPLTPPPDEQAND